MSKNSRRGVQAPRSPAKTPINQAATGRIQGAVANQNGGGVPKGSYVGRMQQALAKTSK